MKRYVRHIYRQLILPRYESAQEALVGPKAKPDKRCAQAVKHFVYLLKTKQNKTSFAQTLHVIMLKILLKRKKF